MISEATAAPRQAAQHDDLFRSGKNAVDTGRYIIRGKEDELKIYDKETGKWIKLWGDPHGVTSDGDKFQFHEDNLTFDLPDGTKVTVIPTEKDANGLAFLDRVAIMKGDEAFMMKGLHDGEKGVKITRRDDVAKLDKKFADGTVLQVGDELDDLFNNGNEIVGGDPTAKFGEWVLDGLGGESLYDFYWNSFEQCSELDKMRPDEFANLDLYEKLALILAELESERDEAVNRMGAFAGKQDSKEYTLAQARFQSLEGQVNSFKSLMSNVTQAENQTLRTIANNVRG